MKSFLAKVESLDHNLYLDVSRFGIPYSNIVVFHKYESKTQEWWFAPCPDDEGYYYLQNLYSNNVLDCYGGGVTGIPCVITFPLYHFANDTQKWEIVEIPGEKEIVKIRNKAQKKYLSVEGPAMCCTKLEDESNLKSQQWKIHGFIKEVKCSEKKIVISDIIMKK